MSSAPLSFATCDREPIHLIGGVQPHGALIAYDGLSEQITHASANCAAILGHGASDLIGKPIETLLGKRQIEAFANLILDPMEPDVFRPFPCDVIQSRGKPRKFHSIAHESRGRTLVEFFKMEGEDDGAVVRTRRRHDVIDSIRDQTTLADLCNAVTHSLRSLTGFDRVMIYKFDQDQHGEVIAEATDLEDRFLHLHYPASDIPAQARAAYLKNLSRSISNVDAEPVPIEPLCDAESTAPLDLTFAKLRAVSPIHLEYLRNMGVAASMSVSILVDNALWGLIACHHSTPLYIPSDVLMFSEIVGKMLGAQIEQIAIKDRLQRLISMQTIIDDVSGLSEQSSLHERMVQQSEAICALLNADGLVGSLGNTRIAHNAPEDICVNVGAFERHDHKHAIALDHLDEEVVRPEDAQERCHGGIYLPFNSDPFAPHTNTTPDHVFIFRDAQDAVIRWAGRPDAKQVVTKADGSQRLGPRNSFAEWRESIHGRCRSFTRDDVNLAESLRVALATTRTQEREYESKRAMEVVANQRDRLRQQLESGARLMSMAEMASSISHELNQPLTALINYAETCRLVLETANTEDFRETALSLAGDISEQANRAGEMVHRLRALVKRRPSDYVPLDLVGLLREHVLLSVPLKRMDNIAVSWSIPDALPTVKGDKLQLSQVIFNLVRNACEAMAEVDDQRLGISITIDEPDAVAITIEDNGTGFPDSYMENSFQPFHTTKQEGMGLGLTVSRSIVEAHGGTLFVKQSRQPTRICFTLPSCKVKKSK